MDETPPQRRSALPVATVLLQPSSRSQCSRRLFFHWARSGSCYDGLEVRDGEDAVLRAALRPAVKCSKIVGMRSRIRLPLEDHYILRDEIKNIAFHVQQGDEMVALNLRQVERILQQKCLLGPGCEDFHRVILTTVVSTSNNDLGLLQPKPDSGIATAPAPTPVELLLSELEKHVRWNEDAGRKLQELRSLLSIQTLDGDLWNLWFSSGSNHLCFLQFRVFLVLLSLN